MVDITQVRASNAQMAKQKATNGVFVFAGATGGIGLSTLRSVNQLVERSTFYVIGRSESRFHDQMSRLQADNAGKNKTVFLEAEFSLLKHVDAVCAKIAAAESKVDHVFMSPGMLPFQGPKFTSEGLDVCCALSYYSRIRLVSNLLPLLQQSDRATVLSVLNGGKEARMEEKDLQLARSWSIINVVNHNTTMTTLAHDYLSHRSRNVSFLHAYPGWVKTDIFRELDAPVGSGMMAQVAAALLKSIAWVCLTLGGVSAGECGERQAFQLLQRQREPGSWRLDHASEESAPSKVLEQYRTAGWAATVWDQTADVFERALHGTLGQQCNQPAEGNAWDSISAALRIVGQAVGVAKAKEA